MTLWDDTRTVPFSLTMVKHTVPVERRTSDAIDLITVHSKYTSFFHFFISVSMAAWVPLVIFSTFWGLVGIVGPFLVPRKNPNRQ